MNDDWWPPPQKTTTIYTQTSLPLVQQFLPPSQQGGRFQNQRHVQLFTEWRRSRFHSLAVTASTPLPTPNRSSQYQPMTRKRMPCRICFNLHAPVFHKHYSAKNARRPVWKESQPNIFVPPVATMKNPANVTKMMWLCGFLGVKCKFSGCMLVQSTEDK